MTRLLLVIMTVFLSGCVGAGYIPGREPLECTYVGQTVSCDTNMTQVNVDYIPDLYGARNTAYAGEHIGGR